MRSPTRVAVGCVLATCRPRASIFSTVPPPDAAAARSTLLDAIASFDAAIAADGVPSIDFGVKGGELDGDTRAPRDLYQTGAYRAVSDRVGDAADAVIAAVDAAALVNPTAAATDKFGTADGAASPLHGKWSNMFTTAADAVFSESSERGAALVYNQVDGVSGRTTNCIDFLPRSSPVLRAVRQTAKPPTLESLRVILSTTAVAANRIELVFRLVKARLNLRLFGRWPLKLTLFFPVPGPFLTRILFAFRPSKKPPPAFFDVLYLDDELRVHKTGQGNVFVQRRAAAA